MSSNYFQLIKLESFGTRFCNEDAKEKSHSLLSYKFVAEERSRKGRKNLKAFPSHRLAEKRRAGAWFRFLFLRTSLDGIFRNENFFRRTTKKKFSCERESETETKSENQREYFQPTRSCHKVKSAFSAMKNKKHENILR